MYADDGILYSSCSFVPQPPSNQSFHESKSRRLKKDNNWLTSFKFLGLEYDGAAGTIKGHTRNGSRLEVDSRRVINEVFRLLKALKPFSYGAVKDLEVSYLIVTFLDYLYPSYTVEVEPCQNS